MKKLILLLCLITGFTTTSIAQLGKMQFEDAEQKYAEGDYKKAIELLDKAEKTNGKSNPMIEHLRIMARIEIVKQNPSKEAETAKIARREAADFLKKYDGDSRIEDKYREVYNATNSIDELIKKINANTAVKIATEDMDYEYISSRYKFGMTEAELKAVFPGYVETTTNSDGTTALVNFNEEVLTFLVNTKTGKSYGYLSEIISTKNSDPTCAACKKVFEEQLAIMTKKLGAATKKGVKDNNTEYIWEKGQKITGLKTSCYVIREGVIMGSTEVYSYDYSLK